METRHRKEFFNGLRERKPNSRASSFILDAEYKKFFPLSFFSDPIDYLEKHGQAKKIHMEGKSPKSALKVFELPNLQADSELLSVIAKVVSVDKVGMRDREGGMTEDPLFELKILAWAKTLGLPAAEPIGRISGDSLNIILYKKLNRRNTCI